jgi:glutamate/tyrosine decarboxylase-like PLP-dependent enzyme
MFPTTPLSKQELLETLRAYRQRDVRWREGRVMAGVYDPGLEVEGIAKAAYMEFLSENALYPNFYPSLIALENDVVNAMKSLLRAPKDSGCCGNFTSGGTESIMLAVKAARDEARALRNVTAPEIVVCRTTHPAFHKAAHYLGLRVVVTEFAPDYRADLGAYRAAINANTVLIVGSAPCYSHGVVDPIPQLGQLALERGVRLHVDACVGGVQLSVMRGAGMAVPEFDLSVPGVSSLSVDLHKYGYAPKNASVILYGSRRLRRFAMYANAETTGYSVINTTVLSSKSGGPLAGAWATLRTLAEPGYTHIVQTVMDATHRALGGINAIPELEVLGTPDLCVFTFAPRPEHRARVNVFELEDEMAIRGWSLQAQPSAPGTPANLHISLNLSNAPHVDAMLSDLRACVAVVQTREPIDVDALLGAVMAVLEEPDEHTLETLLGLVGVTGGALPERYALINTLLDALPDAHVNGLLVQYLDSVYA